MKSKAMKRGLSIIEMSMDIPKQELVLQRLVKGFRPFPILIN